MENYTFTIVMPTYNSEKTIKYSLDSIKTQNYDLSKIECLVIDGGSTDKTLEFAEKYSFVKILENPKRLPEYAKQIGFKNARGKYIVKMDSDEAFTDKNTLLMREKAFSEFPQAHLLVADRMVYVPIEKKEVCGTYINACGDPFTFFIYRQKRTVSESFFKNIVSEKSNGLCLMDFNNCLLRPIADGGTTTVDAEYIKKTFDKEERDSISFICSVSDRILDNNGLCLCIKNDSVAHRSNAGFKTYLKKIRFRIINNLFKADESGFSSRNISAGKKKYLFPLYTLLFFPAFADSLMLSIRYKDVCLMLHFLYCYYTCFYILLYLIMKALKLKKQNEEY